MHLFSAGADSNSCRNAASVFEGDGDWGRPLAAGW